MAKQTLSDCAFWLGPYSLKSNINEVRTESVADEVDVTNMGSSGWKEFLAGLVKGGITYAGFFEAQQPDKYIHERMALSDVPVSIGPTGGADGAIMFITKPLTLVYNRQGAVGEAFKINVAGPTNTPIVSATCLGNATYTSTANGTGRQIGAASATQTIYAALHVTGASVGDTCDVTIESDATGAFSGSETERFAFTQVASATITSEWLTLAGAITDEYWRAVVTIAGNGSESFDVVVSLGIR